jgi:hypothetical protein
MSGDEGALESRGEEEPGGGKGEARREDHGCRGGEETIPKPCIAQCIFCLP